jgi:hypothetical protein
MGEVPAPSVVPLPKKYSRYESYCPRPTTPAGTRTSGERSATRFALWPESTETGARLSQVPRDSPIPSTSRHSRLRFAGQQTRPGIRLKRTMPTPGPIHQRLFNRSQPFACGDFADPKLRCPPAQSVFRLGKTRPDEVAVTQGTVRSHRMATGKYSLDPQSFRGRVLQPQTWSINENWKPPIG